MKQNIKVVVFLFFSLGVSFNLSAGTFEHESWPGEGIPVFRVKTDVLMLRSEPSIKSLKTSQLLIKKGSIVTFPYGVKELLKSKSNESEPVNTRIMLDKSIQKTVTPGLIKASVDGSFEGSRYGHNDSEIFAYKKDDVIEELLDLSEGTCIIRFHDDILLIEGCFSKEIFLDQKMIRISNPDTEWWISFVNGEKTVGWLRMYEKDSPLEDSGSIR